MDQPVGPDVLDGGGVVEGVVGGWSASGSSTVAGWTNVLIFRVNWYFAMHRLGEVAR
jgi:hypothetical protein